MFDEVKFVIHDTSENGIVYTNENVNFIDCILLRRNTLWGYIAHPKTYHFHDKLERTDKFSIVEPQYKELIFVKEEASFDSQKYARNRRIVAARKDSLFGALEFETGEVVVPFKYKLPIRRIWSRFNRRGMEFLSVDVELIEFFISYRSLDDSVVTIINSLGNDVSFLIDRDSEFDIYKEYGKEYLYVESLDTSKWYLELWDYNSGERVFYYQRPKANSYLATQRIDENILAVTEYVESTKRYEVRWFNLFNGKLMLYHSNRYNNNYTGLFGLLIGGGEKKVYFKKQDNVIGKVIGSGESMEIDSIKRVFMKE